MELKINGKRYDIADNPSHTLLYVLRDDLGLTGTKFGCGVGLCGACTVHVDGVAVRSCILPASALAGKSITTIEGLAAGPLLHPVQQAFLELQAPQCGWCQSGQMMVAAALLAGNPEPDDEQIVAAMTANLCRCGTYGRIRRAIARAAELARQGGGS